MSYIYGLVDPRTGQIRYIGRSEAPERRLSHHMSTARTGNDATPKADWLRELIAANTSPLVAILYTVYYPGPRRENTRRIEKRFIEWGKKQQWPLLNKECL